MPSVIVPAHNEERVLGRLLAGLAEQPRDAGEDRTQIQVIVVANGCEDATADVAAGFPGVEVIETPVPSKSGALRLGDRAASSFPRLFVDADVILGAADVRRLCLALETPGVLAAGPERTLPMDGVAAPVRWYYDVWQRLPVVRDELFGRGVIAVNEAGHRRLATFLTLGDQVMADDLMISLTFGVQERVVVPAARVEIRPPRTYPDLMRRRIRAMTGNARLAADLAPSADGSPPPRRAPRTGVRDLRGLLRHEAGIVRKLRLVLKIGVFLFTATASRVLARRAARRRDTAWLRDESSRA